MRDHPGIARVALSRHRAVTSTSSTNGFLAVNPLLDEDGYQKCTIAYPGLTNDEIYGAVEKFYRSFYFRPSYIFKSIRKMATSAEETKRLLKEGMQFLSTMRQRRHQLRDNPTVQASAEEKGRSDGTREAKMKLLVLIPTLGILASAVYYLAAIVAGLLFAHHANSALKPLPKIPPRVAILKPLRGVSEHLRENIISFLEIAYSRVEYIFGVASYEDRAIDVPVGLRAPYQFANITVTVGDEPGCSNRKVAKLIKMAERASDKTDIFVLSDADISVEPDHLKRVVSEADGE